MKYWTKKEIAAKLATDDQWLLRGLVALYKLQTQDEKRDLTTRHDNMVGFNAGDGKFMTLKGRLVSHGVQMSEAEMYTIRKRMAKYAQQLADIANGERGVA